MDLKTKLKMELKVELKSLIRLSNRYIILFIFLLLCYLINLTWKLGICTEHSKMVEALILLFCCVLICCYFVASLTYTYFIFSDGKCMKPGQ